MPFAAELPRLIGDSTYFAMCGIGHAIDAPRSTPQEDPVKSVQRPGADHELDSVDAALIRALQSDGRTSIHDLARQISASRDLVAQRLRHLIEHERLRIVAALEPRYAGHRVLINAKVDVDGPAGPVADAISGIADAVFVSLVSGPLPIVFESRHGSNDELHDTLEAIRCLPGVRKLAVSTYVEILKGFFVSDDRRDIAIDDLDQRLIAELQMDGRASFRSLADTVHLSPSSVRARVRRLIDAGAIRISAIKPGGISRYRLAVGFGVHSCGDAAAVRTYIQRSPDVEFAARSHGTFDFIGTLVGPSSAHLLSIMDEIRALPGTTSLETWMHYELVKEDYARALGRVLHPRAARAPDEG